MPRDYVIKWDQKDLSDAIQRLMKTSRYTFTQNLWFAARAYIERARRLTPIAPKVVRTKWYQDDAGNWKKLKGGEEIVKAPPKGRGFAKQGWNEVSKKLGIWAKGQQYPGPSGSRHADAKNGTKRRIPFIEFANQVPYIVELDKDKKIAKRAISKTVDRLKRQIVRDTNRKITRAWAGR